MATRKSRTAKKSAVRRKSGARDRARTAFARFEAELPPNLRDFSKRVQRGLSRLEKQIENAQRDARRRWTRLLRDVSHQLGRVESEGERRWRAQSLQARREAVRLLRRLEKAIEPPKAAKASPSRKRPARKRAAPRKAEAPVATVVSPAPPSLSASPGEGPGSGI
jgi:hypothetical protein